MTPDISFYQQLEGQHFGYKDWWKDAPLSRLDDMLCDDNFRLYITGCKEEDFKELISNDLFHVLQDRIVGIKYKSSQKNTFL